MNIWTVLLPIGEDATVGEPIEDDPNVEPMSYYRPICHRENQNN